MFQIRVVEHDRFFGKECWINEYETYEEAMEFVKWCNNHNNQEQTPETYYTVDYLGEV